MKAYKKNDEVTYIADWDEKGTFYYRHAIVHSCGNVQMVLTDAESGKEMGRHFDPTIGLVRNTWRGTFPRMTDEKAEKLCLSIAADRLTERRATYTRLAAIEDSSAGYKKAMLASIDELHEPRAIRYQQ